MVERPVLTRWDGNSASSTTSRRAELLLRNRSLFSQSLATLGYFEGKNIVIEDRSAAGNSERLGELARDVVASKVEVSWTSTSARASRPLLTMSFRGRCAVNCRAAEFCTCRRAVSTASEQSCPGADCGVIAVNPDQPGRAQTQRP